MSQRRAKQNYTSNDGGRTRYGMNNFAIFLSSLEEEAKEKGELNVDSVNRVSMRN